MTLTGHDTLLARVPIRDSYMAYRTAGESPDTPVALFLHGNPTSSFIWRHIIQRVAPTARAIAPDLIGFGQSGKPDMDYRFASIADYLDDFIDALGLESFYLVAQDWGTAFAFRLAARRPESVRGLAFMEFIRPVPTWADFHQSDTARETFQALRTAGVGERLILRDNVFLEKILPGSTVRDLSLEEMEVYRAPFVAASTRRPMLQLPRELPIAGTPADVYAELTAAHDKLRSATYPKLLFVGDPGALVSPKDAETFASSVPNVEVVRLPSGRHYLQEDHPTEIGDAIARFIGNHETRSRSHG